jgi:transposase
MQLLAKTDAPHTPQSLKSITRVEVLRKIWEQQYVMIDRELRMRSPKEVPEAAHRIESPYELEAHCATKRGMRWVGYKVHLAELCDEDLPNLITSLRMTLATATDVKQVFHPLGRVRRRQAAARWVVGRRRLRLLKQSRFQPGEAPDRPHRIDTYEDRQWQAKVKEGSMW